MSSRHLGIGLLGVGVVGGGVAQILPGKATQLAARAGIELRLVRALVRDPAKERTRGATLPPLGTDGAAVVDDPAVQVVVEVLGGEQPALDLIRRALRAGKHVVTANKEVIAKHGAELFAIAQQHGVALQFEASVGGGIPVIAVFQHDLAANWVSRIAAIINGTTNYILSRMASEGADFGDALADAQALGYAEADPTADVDAYDPCYKLAILASLAFGEEVRPEGVHREGIRSLSRRDFAFARSLGYAIKLLAIARRRADGIEARVHPVMLPASKMLAKVDGVFNAIEVEADLVGTALLYGQGAGSLPTASAIVADVIAIADALARGDRPRTPIPPSSRARLVQIESIDSRYYLRLSVPDKPGVLAAIAAVFGRNAISIASVQQPEQTPEDPEAELVIMTHRASEAGMQATIAQLSGLDVSPRVQTVLRIED
jgi:homoserine dehydrogenase